MMQDDYLVLSEKDKVDMIKPISKRVVHRTHPSLPRGKSPSPNGLNVEFYVFYQNITGDHFFNAISLFFFKYHLDPSFLGKTFMALNPKTDNPILIQDFRSISLCNLCYKVIANIFAYRLRTVIPKLMGLE